MPIPSLVAAVGLRLRLAGQIAERLKPGLHDAPVAAGTDPGERPRRFGCRGTHYLMVHPRSASQRWRRNG